jgi:3-phenylpropionate/trans-cinnamate dioxygenase ferredoxin subunit/anthranilate 1,2-dioxygenase ferredoxin subunit
MIAVAAESSLREGETLRVDLQGQVLCLAKSDGQIYAFQEFCTHRFGPLSEGAICQNQIECPWHRSVFDMATGKAVHGPAKEDLKTFRVEVRDGQIHVAPRPEEPAREEKGIAA